MERVSGLRDQLDRLNTILETHVGLIAKLSGEVARLSEADVQRGKKTEMQTMMYVLIGILWVTLGTTVGVIYKIQDTKIEKNAAGWESIKESRDQRTGELVGIHQNVGQLNVDVRDILQRLSVVERRH